MSSADALVGTDRLRIESERRLAYASTSVLLLPSAALAFLDYELVADPERLSWLYALRVAQAAVYVIGLVLLRRASSRDELRRLVFGLALMVVLLMSAISFLRPADNFLPIRPFIVASAGLFVAYPNRLWYQLAPWLVLTGVLVGLLWGHYETMTSADRFSVVVIYLLAGAIGLAVAHNRRSLERDFDEAIRREREAVDERERSTAALHLLEGIIPICSYCRQVRTEAGAWEKIPAYVASRSGAEFAHELCPKCAAR